MVTVPISRKDERAFPIGQFYDEPDTPFNPADVASECLA